MDWTTRLAIILVLTTLTGSAMYGIWLGVGKLLERIGLVNIIYVMLKVCLIFWFVPFAYIFLFLSGVPHSLWGGFLFFNTPTLQVVCKILVWTWIVAVIYYMFRYVCDVLFLRAKYRDMMECDDKQKQIFSQVCKELGVSEKRLKLVRDPGDGGPKIAGVFQPKVLIPMNDLDDEELRVVFYHELIHYRQKDVCLKHLTYIARVFHCFNPFIYMLDKQVQVWGEYACDYEVIKKFNGDIKFYYLTLTKILSETASVDDNYLMSQMATKKGDLLDRVERLARSYKRMKKGSKFIAGLVVSLMFVLSTASVYATSMAVGHAYMAAYYATVVEEEESVKTVMTDDGMIEYEVSGLEKGFIEEIGEINTDSLDNEFSVNATQATSYGFTWAIRSGVSMRGSMFDASSGGSISVMADVTPADVTYRMGIVEPDGTRRYVQGTGYMSHKFLLDQTGSYCIYIQNLSDDSIDADGTYMIK